MSASLFIAGDGLISKTSEKEFSLDLINLRDNFFAPSDYYYNILRWRTIVLSYGCGLNSISPQKMDIHFDRPTGETSTISRQFKLPEFFLGEPVLNKITIYDYDNGKKTILAEAALLVDSSLNLTSDLQERPVSTIIGQNTLQIAELSPAEFAKWNVGWKVQIKDALSTYTPVLTIQSKDSLTNRITFDQAPDVLIFHPIILQSENSTKFKVLVSDDGILSTDEELVEAPSPLFKVLNQKDNGLDPDVFSRLVVGNDGVLGIITDSGSTTVNNSFFIKSDTDIAWKVSFKSNGHLQMINEPATLIGKEIEFAANELLVTEQLIDYKPF